MQMGMGVLPWVPHGAMLGCGTSRSPSAVGKAPVHPVRQGRMNWEAIGKVMGQGLPHRPIPPSHKMGGRGISPGTRSIPPPTPFPRFCPRAPTSHGPSAICWGHPTCPASTHGCPGLSAPPHQTRGYLGGRGGQVEGSLEPLLMSNEINTTKQHMVPHHTWAPTSGSGEGNAPTDTILPAGGGGCHPSLWGLLWDMLCSCGAGPRATASVPPTSPHL